MGSLLAERARCTRCQGRCFLEPEAPNTANNDRWVYRCVACGRARTETDGEVFLRTGRESVNVLKAWASAEIRLEQSEKRRRRKVRVTASV